jgi:eukaryotic-like serine/threonine-protein kinase
MAECPPPEQLALLLAERLEAADSERIAVHVESCAGCRRELDELLRKDPVSARLVAPTAAAPEEPGPDETFLRELRELPRFPPEPVLERAARGVAPETPAPDHRPARIGDYDILDEIGRGGMGVVYKARQKSLNRVVALKVVLAGEHTAPEDRARFRTEAEAAARLQHPNIVQVFEVADQDGRPYLSLEFVDSGNLADRLGGKPQDPRAVAPFVEKLARAVHHAHEHGVVHRDLKPANILLQTGSPGPAAPGLADCEPKVTDFGLAKQLDAEPGTPAKTRTGTVMGTPEYMAPEQATGRGPVGPAVDVHALGVIVYEMLTGHRPYEGWLPWDTLDQVCRHEPVAPRHVQPKVPADLETICLKCLHKEPHKRYPSALALAEDLRRFREGRPIMARPVGAFGKTWRWCRRNPGVAALLGALAVSLVAGAAAATTFALRENRRAEEARANARRAYEQAYVSDLRLIQRAWPNNEIGPVRLALDRQLPANTGGRDLRGFEWYYWRRLLRQQLAELKGHDGAVTFVSASPDGRLLASASEDGTVRVWDGTGGGQRVLRGHEGPVWAVAFSPDGRLLASAANDRTIRVWDADTGAEVRRLTGHTDQVRAVAFHPDGRRLLSGGLDREIRVWDATTGEVVRTLDPAGSAVWHLAVSPDGRMLAAALDQERVRVWDADRGQELHTLQGDPTGERVRCVAFSPDGRRLAVAGGREAVRLWDPASGRRVQALDGVPTGYVRCVAFAPDGKRLAVASDELDVVLLSLEGPGRDRWHLRGHTGPVAWLAFAPDGRRLASASRDGTVRLWDPAEAAEAVVLRQPSVSGLSSSPDGTLLASASIDRRVRVWDVNAARLGFTLAGHTAPVLSVCFGPDGLTLASAAQDASVRLWDLATRQERRVLRGHTGYVLWACFSPDGRRVASASTDQTARVWDAETGAEQLTLRGHTDHVRRVGFSPDGRLLATAGHDRTVKLWDAATGRELASFSARERPFEAVCFSPTGDRLAAFDGGPVVTTWMLSGEPGGVVLEGHTQRVPDLCFAADGERVATASVDHTVRVWKAATGEELLTLCGHPAPVGCVCFSPDGRWLASGSADGIRLWSAPRED